MVSRVREMIERYGLLGPGDRVVVAVSGGRDSVCLLHLLRSLAGAWDLSLHVAHLDHALRGAAGRRDAAFVRRLAARWNLPATIDALRRLQTLQTITGSGSRRMPKRP